jgi:hypothetical protein
MSFVKLSIFGTSFEVGFILLSFISLTPISGHYKICRSPTRWHGCVIHPIPPYPAHSLQGAFGLVWYVDPLFPLIPQMSSPVPQRINSQAHPWPSRRS